MVGTPAVEVKSDNCLLPQESTQIKHRPRRVATSTHITRLRGYPSNRTGSAWLRARAGSLGADPGLAAFPGLLAGPVLAWGGWWRAGRGSGPGCARRPVP